MKFWTRHKLKVALLQPLGFLGKGKYGRASTFTCPGHGCKIGDVVYLLQGQEKYRFVVVEVVSGTCIRMVSYPRMLERVRKMLKNLKKGITALWKSQEGK